MEEWKIEAIKALLETEVSEVEPGQRVYLSSETYGSGRYHVIDKHYDGIQIEQLETSEKWSKRVSFQNDEIAALLKTLLMWYLNDNHEENTAFFDAELGDIDEHPF